MKTEYVNTEMRETLGFPFQNGRFIKPGKQGKSSPFQKERYSVKCKSISVLFQVQISKNS